MHDLQLANAPAEKKRCGNCMKQVNGRSDKRFCSDGCRNQHHNARIAASTNYIRRINNALRRNRHILASLVGDTDAHQVIEKAALRDKGFMFEYITHLHTVEGMTIRCCYDVCYYHHTDDSVAIARTQR